MSHSCGCREQEQSGCHSDCGGHHSCAETSCDSGCPGCGQQSCADPLACGAKMWKKAFFEAMHEAHVAILKSKIEKAWGPMMDKTADGLLASMETFWQSMQGQAKSKEDFKNLLREQWQNKKK
jgi:hypothetical protein